MTLNRRLLDFLRRLLGSAKEDYFENFHMRIMFNKKEFFELLDALAVLVKEEENDK